MEMAGQAGEELGTNEAEGSVFVFVDESYRPVVAAAAVVVEASDASNLERAISAKFEEIANWTHFDGLESFEEFRRSGFHATSNPHEVQAAFAVQISSFDGFRSLVCYSDGSTRPELSDKRRLFVVFDQLVRDVLRTYGGRPKVTFCFESAGAMDKYVERVVRRAVRSTRKVRGTVEVSFGTKRNPYLLALPDYVLHIFNRWKASAPDGRVVDPARNESRAFRAILGSVSMARCIDTSEVLRRNFQ